MIDTVALRKRILDLAIQGLLTPDITVDEEVKLKVNGILIERGVEDDIDLSEIPYEIKKTWCWIKLGWIMGIERGGSPRPIKAYITDADDGINWIKIGDVSKDGKYIESTNEKIKPEGEKKSRHVYPGDFLLTNSMSFGRPYISKIDGCVHDGWLILRNAEELFDMDFLYHLLSSSYAYNQFSKKASGATVDNLNIDKVADAIIPLPPIEEQKIIVEKVEEMMQYIETIANLQTLYSTDLEALKSKVIDAGIRGKLTEQLPEYGTAEELLKQIEEEKKQLAKEKKIKATKDLPEITDDEIPFEIPKNWKWVQFGEIAETENGDRSSKYPVERDYVEFGIPFFGAKDISEGVLKFDNVRYISEEKFQELGNGKLRDGDFICLLRGSVGKCALFEIDEKHKTGFICAQMVIIRCIDKRLVPYIKWVLNSPYYAKTIDFKATGIGVRQLPAKEIYKILIPLPPLEEQERIVKKVEQLMVCFD